MSEKFKQIGVFLGSVFQYTHDCKGGYFKTKQVLKKGAAFEQRHLGTLKPLFEFSGRRKFIETPKGGVIWDFSNNHSVPSHNDTVVMEVWEETLDNGSTRFIAPFWGYIQELLKEAGSEK